MIENIIKINIIHCHRFVLKLSSLNPDNKSPTISLSCFNSFLISQINQANPKNIIRITIG